MQKIRFLCIGEWVVSGNDGENHYVSGTALPQLYNVDRAQCTFSDPTTLEQHSRFPEYKALIWLRPVADGKYKLPSYSICKCGATILWMETKEHKKIPVDCRHDLVGQKVFDIKTMIAHFSTCPLAKDFRKKKGPKNAKTSA